MARSAVVPLTTTDTWVSSRVFNSRSAANPETLTPQCGALLQSQPGGAPIL